MPRQLEGLPREILTRVATFLQNPFDHLSFAPGTSGAILRSADDIKVLVDRGGKIAVHRHLSLLGSINIGDWINGYFSSIPDLFPSAGRPYPDSAVTAFDQSGVDWLAEDGLLDVRPCAPNIADHVILYSAFASQPPVVEAHIKVDWMSDGVPVENHDGITVGDVMDKIREWYKQPPTDSLRLLVLERMRDSLGLEDAVMTDLDGLDTREALLEELYDQESALGEVAQQGVRVSVDGDEGLVFDCFVDWVLAE
ncbi:hypothetical protein EHS25_008558 [Saitozyma podzolica]|uniref:DUF6699 domain-containing protein n=1 Tax=Saitozyma podzolica TaxID=1890683 RepID=A0A427YM28_9TREE|nr:hypothetical protein EHS25_008558 [Saitozyma podzolica]